MNKNLPVLYEERGFTLLTVLFMVVILGLGVGLAGTSWTDLMQRAREKELFWRGDQYRRAIESYYRFKQGPGGLKSFPHSLDHLVRDPRFPEVRRHIRRLYDDPMTGEDWVPVKNPAGRIIGVRSSSDREPFRKSGFPEEYPAFEGATRYSQWEFVYTPQATQPNQPAGRPGTRTPGARPGQRLPGAGPQ